MLFRSNWISISAGVSHNMAIKSDGTLWTWGTDLSVRYATGKVDVKRVSARTPIPAAPGHDWKHAVAGGVHTLAIKKDGTLWAWGANWAGSLGTGKTGNSAVPLQVGSATNWIKVWAGSLESVGLQADGSLWYWGDDPDPAFDMDIGNSLVPTRVSADTNWVDVGFGVNTVFAIKADGTLWTWGRNAHVYSDAQDITLDAVPTRVGTNSDWASIPACGVGWCQGLTKKDGSLWLMDASDFDVNLHRGPSKALRFRRIELEKDVVAFTAGVAHISSPGGHLPIGVALTRDGEVWTWGMMLGNPLGLGGRLLYSAIKLMDPLGVQVRLPAPDPAIRQTPWRLPHVETGIPPKQ